ncbi:ATP-binding cassette domain-containing protein [Piscinibacter defluvii]|uniref:ATP-binding cassette domain-containing protein n=1 Tax=Piscinibacter defluvii TaxID=1796922 RepID=UPI000FDD495C|nr:ATP-binding cassette domain-containing protein [Piscinibacter defluvii]
MLELLQVGISTPQGPLLAGLDARIGAGEVLVVRGPSGSGKSSLLAWLCGTLPAPLAGHGTVRLDGRDVTRLPTAQRRIGILFQDDLLFPHVSVLENLLFALPPGPAAARRAQAQAALEEAGLAGYGPRAPHTLSGGQRARVALLRALLAQPRALLLDEPFSRLDAALRVRFRAQVFERLRAQGIPALLVTHDPQDAPSGARQVQLGPTDAGDTA